jgi:sugar phosphate isomerase/epimerase
MPTIALSTGSLYSYGIARVFELAAEAGFDAVEVLADHRWDSRQPSYLRRLSQKTGLPVAAIHTPFVVISTPGWPQDPVERLRASAALARDVGAGVVVAHLPLSVKVIEIKTLGSECKPFRLPIPFLGERDYRHFLLNGLAEFEATEGVRVGVENMPARRALGQRVTIHSLNNLETLPTFPHLTLDTTHIGTWGLDLLAVYEQLKERIVHIHLSNFDGKEHRLPSEGHLPLGELLKRLTHDGYDGTVTCEFDPVPLGAEDEALVLENLRRVVAFCRKYTIRE